MECRVFLDGHVIARKVLSSQLRRRLEATLMTAGPEGRALTIGGSWGTDDVHLPPRSKGNFQSLSDIDILSPLEVDTEFATAIHARVTCALGQVGMVASGVSIRSKGEFESLPHSAPWNAATATAAYWLDGKSMLAFWSYVAAVEGAITLRRHEKIDRESVSSYAIVKFFFTFARTAALMQGIVLLSYSDICLWTARKRPGLPVREALEVKHGTRPLLTKRSARLLLAPITLREFGHVPDAVCSVAADILETLASPYMPPVDLYASELALLAHSPALQRVVRHEQAKLSVNHG